MEQVCLDVFFLQLERHVGSTKTFNKLNNKYTSKINYSLVSASEDLIHLTHVQHSWQSKLLFSLETWPGRGLDCVQRCN